MHVDKLRRQVQVAFQIACIYHVDDDIGGVLYYLFPHIEFFGRVGRQRVGAGQIDDVELVAFECGVSYFCIHGDAGVVAYTLVCS